MIDPDAAELVKEFASGCTIAQAVARFSKGKHADAERILEEALPVLQTLIAAGLLVPADSNETLRVAPLLAGTPGVNGWEIMRCVQAFDDTDVYQVRRTGGEVCALKLCHSHPSSASLAIQREAKILAGLNSPVAPRLRESGEWSSRPYLIMEWLAGTDAQTTCAEFRREAGWGSRRDLHRIAGSILRAYRELHERGVLHGDVHPRNVLIDGRRSAKIVDFGYAEMLGEEQSSTSPRAGVSFFFDPEFAESARNGGAPPSRTLCSEQYSVGALIYLLLTGSHYLDFVLEKDAMLRQIAEDPMVPFESRGIASWPDVERALEKALSKRPGDRFASLADFSQAWEAAETPRPAAADRGDDTKLSAIRREVLAQTAVRGPLLTGGPLPAPSTSITYGSAGTGGALYRIACAWVTRSFWRWPTYGRLAPLARSTTLALSMTMVSISRPNASETCRSIMARRASMRCRHSSRMQEATPRYERAPRKPSSRSAGSRARCST